jgi:hypothetical protein
VTTAAEQDKTIRDIALLIMAALDERDETRHRAERIATRLGIDPDEGTDAVADILRRETSGPGLAAAVERAEKAGRACRTLGRTLDGQCETLAATVIAYRRDGAEAAMQWVISLTEGWLESDLEPGEAWDGVESADNWSLRTEAARKFNDGKPVKLLSPAADDVLLHPVPGKADVVCAVPVPGGTCGKPLAEGPCALDHGKTEVDGQASLFDPAEPMTDPVPAAEPTPAT